MAENETKRELTPISKNGDLVVGTDIVIEDITQFYYTYATSTYPPKYQRYRFYIKDGKYFFYHEKREGNHFPLGEADITVSGSIELSGEQWAAFFGHLKGGAVEKRKERTESGGSGPWLFLYWKGDRSKYQEFSFVSKGTQISFEELCAKLKNSQ